MQSDFFWFRFTIDLEDDTLVHVDYKEHIIRS